MVKQIFFQPKLTEQTTPAPNGCFILARHKLRNLSFVTFLNISKTQALPTDLCQDAHVS